MGRSLVFCFLTTLISPRHWTKEGELLTTHFVSPDFLIECNLSTQNYRLTIDNVKIGVGRINCAHLHSIRCELEKSCENVEKIIIFPKID